MERELTLGEKRVQRSFNPSAREDVEAIKSNYASMIDGVESYRNERNGREISLAQTQLETACMYTVKSLFI